MTPDSASSSTGGSPRPWPALAAGLLALTVAVAGLAWTAAAGDDVEELRDRAAWTELLLVAHDVTTAATDELTALTAVALEHPASDDVEAIALAGAAPAARASALRDGLDRLEAMSDLDPVGNTAETLIDLWLDLPSRPGQLPLLDDLLNVGTETTTVVLAAVGGHEPVTAMAQLMAQSMVPRMVLSDAGDVASLDATAVPGWTNDYFAISAEYVADGDAGWLSDDTTFPLASPYIDGTEIALELPAVWEALGTVGRSAAAEPLVAFDAWVRARPPAGLAGAPVSFDDLRVASHAVAAQVDGIVTTHLADLASTSEARAARLGTARLGVGTLAVLLLAVVATAGVLGARRQSRRARGWREAALVDQLTSIVNRRGLEATVAAAAGPDRDGHAVLLFDLDHFKGVNDTYGHAVGDDALRRIAQHATTVASAMPGQATPARLGGDEFVIVAHDLPDPGGDAAAAAAALVTAVASDRVPTDDGPVPLSVSVGVATCVGPLDLEDLLMKADMALYDMKSAGRGGHRVHSGDQG